MLHDLDLNKIFISFNDIIVAVPCGVKTVNLTVPERPHRSTRSELASNNTLRNASSTETLISVIYWIR